MKISLADGLTSAIDVEPAPGSSLAKYLRAVQDIRMAGDLKLDDAPLSSARAALNFDGPVPLGTDRVQLALKAGASGAIEILTAETDGAVFPADPFGDPVAIPAGQAFVGVKVEADVSANLSAGVGDLTFGFDAGGTVTLGSYRRFPGAGTGLREAVAAAIRDIAVPGDLDDLERMPDGSVAIVTGSGRIHFAGEVSLLSAVNPLATASVPVAGDIGVTAGASVALSAGFEMRGEYQLRVQKTGSRIRLGILRKQDRSFDLTVEAVASLDATVRKHSVIELLMRAVSTDWQAETEAFARAGLGESETAAIEDVVEQSLRRQLEIACRYELAAAAGRSAAFLFDIDLGAIDANGRRLVHRALDGDLTGLTAGKPGSIAGVTPIRSIVSSLRERNHRWGINLVGVFNAFSVSRLVTSGQVMLDAESGDLLITDSANADRVRGSMAGRLTDPLKLRSLLAESVLATAAYRCAGAIAVPPDLTLRHTYVEHHARTGRGTMKDNLDVPEALGLLAASDKQRLLAGSGDYGSTTLHVEAAYDDEALRSAFLDDGRARGADAFEQAGLQALLALVQPGEPDDYRRLPGERADVWMAMKQAGQPNIGRVPGVRQRIGSGPESTLRVEVLAGDYTLVTGWGSAMAKLADALREIREYVAQHPGAIAGDNRYRALVRQLADRLTIVVKSTRERFGDPWGIVAMDLVTGRRAAVRVQIASPALAWRGERAAVPRRAQAAAARAG